MIFLLIGAIVVPLVAVPVLYWVSLVLKEKAGYVAFAFSLIPLAVILLAGAEGASSPQGAYSELYPWSPIGTFGLKVDNLSLPILLIISLLVALIALFSVPYMRQRIG